MLTACPYRKKIYTYIHYKNARNPELTMPSPFTACLCFRLLSPSRLEDSMKHIPYSSEEFRTTMSAGMVSLQDRWMMSPTLTFFHFVFTYLPWSLEIVRDKCEYIKTFENQFKLFDMTCDEIHKEKLKISEKDFLQ